MDLQPLPEDVIAQAQQRIAAQRQAARAASERPWRFVFVALLGALLAAFLLLPGLTLEQKLYLALHGVCAQLHNISVGGVQLPLCARDSGMYLSMLLALALLWARGRGRASGLPPWPITAALLALLLLLAVDGINSSLAEMQRAHLYTPRNDLRMATGMGVGIGLGAFVLLVANTALGGGADQRPVMGGWADLGLALALDGLLLLAILSDLSFLAWPLAILVFLGIVGLLFTIALVVAATLMGYDGAGLRPALLARPATLALLLSLGMLAGMALLRLWLEQRGLMPPLALP